MIERIPSPATNQIYEHEINVPEQDLATILVATRILVQTALESGHSISRTTIAHGIPVNPERTTTDIYDSFPEAHLTKAAVGIEETFSTKSAELTVSLLDAKHPARVMRIAEQEDGNFRTYDSHREHYKRRGLEIDPLIRRAHLAYFLLLQTVPSDIKAHDIVAQDPANAPHHAARTLHPHAEQIHTVRTAQLPHLLEGSIGVQHVRITPGHDPFAAYADAEHFSAWITGHFSDIAGEPFHPAPARLGATTERLIVSYAMDANQKISESTTSVRLEIESPRCKDAGTFQNVAAWQLRAAERSTARIFQQAAHAAQGN